MNRRQFTASLGAASALPFVPLPAQAAARTAPAVPAALAAWSRLIARAHPTLTAAKLARHLKVSPEIGAQLFQNLMAKGVEKSTATLATQNSAKPIGQAFQKTTRALVKEASSGIQSPADIKPEDPTDASADQPFQESSRRG